MQSDWYRHFFHGIALDFWRQVVPPQQTLAEADFLEQTLAPAGPARLIDVPSGNGRHTLALAARGHRMIAVDLADEFIREVDAHARAAGLPVQCMLADMRELPGHSELDGAFCFGNSFGYLDHGGTQAFLAALARVLKPGARFVLDTGIAAESLLPALERRRWLRADDIHLLIDNRYDAGASRLDTEYTFIRGGTLETRTSCQHVYTVAEIGRLLDQAGLRVREHYGSVDRQPFVLGHPRLIVVAERR